MVMLFLLPHFFGDWTWLVMTVQATFAVVRARDPSFPGSRRGCCGGALCLILSTPCESGSLSALWNTNAPKRRGTSVCPLLPEKCNSETPKRIV